MARRIVKGFCPFTRGYCKDNCMLGTRWYKPFAPNGGHITVCAIAALAAKIGDARVRDNLEYEEVDDD